jgi:hypothetical protein
VQGEPARIIAGLGRRPSSADFPRHR